jgi:predicted RecB family nuclease
MRFPVLTNDTFASFLYCKRKAFLRAAGTPGRPPDIEMVLLDLERVYRYKALEAFLAQYCEEAVVHEPLCLETALKDRPMVVVNANAVADGLSSAIQALEQTERTTRRGVPVYTPVLFLSNETVSRADKLLLAFNALALSAVQRVLPPTGKIVHGNSYTVLKCKLEPLIREVRKLVAQIQTTQIESTPPRVTLNRHCNRCDFQADCLQLAEESDDLSLLRGMSEPEIEKQRGRGVTTVTQFAYTYRPGRRGKRKTGKSRKHDHALQAVALRDKKVYVLDSPTVPRTATALYLDIEGVPDRNFDYLIGLVAVVDDCTTAYAFWADDPNQEKAIWNACAQVINSFEDYTLYHYGRYEMRFLDRMRRLADVEEATAIDRIRARSCNVLASIYSHIYFPVRSNGLKDIGTFLGVTWTGRSASGLHALSSRLKWEADRDESLKERLLLYNKEDCLALQRVTEFVLSVCTGARLSSVASVRDVPQTKGFYFGKTQFFCQELAHINKCAYSDYQRERVYFRTSPAVRKSLQRKQRAGKKRLQVDKEIECDRPMVCPQCREQGLIYAHGGLRERIIPDLIFTRSGVKKWVIKYTTRRYRCGHCSKTTFAESYRNARPRWGSNLVSWVIYNHVVLRQSYHDVGVAIKELFSLGLSDAFLTRMTLWAAERYKDTYDRMKDRLRRGSVIHADETKATVRTGTGYVWTFTNLEEVVYAYTPSRDGAIIADMLEGFTGVLVSDFYAAYDSPKCPQQKCIIHLVRDINNDVFHYPFDEELKQLAQRLVVVLKPIIETIDTFGLTHRHLNKHKVAVRRYFDYLSTQVWESETASKYQKRILKYHDKLFVFLDHDGIPWNNNNAENAIKEFASRRRIIGGASTERGLQNYLMFLSIYQTCRRKNLSVLRFLRSGNLDIDAFAEGTKNDARNPIRSRNV